MKLQAASLVAVAVAHALPSGIAVYASTLVGGVAFMLLEIGLEGFCKWSAQMEKTGQLSQSEAEDSAPS